MTTNAALTRKIKALIELLGEGIFNNWAERFVGDIALRSKDGKEPENLGENVVKKVEELYHQHCDKDPYLRHANDTQPRGF